MIHHKILTVGALAICLTGCDVSLRLPYPSVFHNDPTLASNAHLIGTRITTALSSTSARIGDTVTFSASNVPGDYACSVYLYTADATMGGDPEVPDPRHEISPAYKLGNLASGSASVSFVVRSPMGNDQYGNPFLMTPGSTYSFMLDAKKSDGTSFGRGGPSLAISD